MSSFLSVICEQASDMIKLSISFRLIMTQFDSCKFFARLLDLLCGVSKKIAKLKTETFEPKEEDSEKCKALKLKI